MKTWINRKLIDFLWWLNDRPDASLARQLHEIALRLEPQAGELCQKVIWIHMIKETQKVRE